jgi:pimeloyl-ACP methyl ester carboxylesterase
MSRYFSILLMMAVMLGVGSALSAPAQHIEGIWLGTLKVQDVSLRLVFKVTQVPDSGLQVLLDSPDQGAKDIPVDQVSFENGKVHFGVSVAQAAFEGTISMTGDEIEGEWQQAGMNVPLILKRTEKAPELARPQETLATPLPYEEIPITYGNIEAGVVLAGTLSLPNSGGPFPAVLLVTGSGPQDRDETVFGHKPFLVLADYLARLGIAVLRVDDRGTGQSSGNFGSANSKDFADDAAAGLVYLKSRKEIDPKRIGMLGHSEGALIADLIAARNKDVAFVVSLSGPAIPGGHLIAVQADAISRAEGMPDSIIEKNRVLRERMFEIARTEKDSLAAAEKLRAVLAELAPESAKDSSREIANMQIRQLLTPWFRFFLTYDPAEDIKKITCPYLAVMGEKDLQVPVAANRAVFEKVFKESGCKNCKIELMPGLNHLMQAANTGSPTEYVGIEETFNPAALKVIGDWIIVQTKK